MISNQEKNFISAVVYIHNNAQLVRTFLETLHGTLSKNFEKYEIICVNDCSGDDSEEIIKNTAKELDSVALSIINMGYYQGMEASINAGVDLAIGDFVFEFENCIIDYEPQLIMDMYYHSLKGFDIVAASNHHSRKTSRLFYWLFNANSHMQYKLATETFRLLSRRAINRTRAVSRSLPYRKAIYASCGLKADTIGYVSINTGKKNSDFQHKTYHKERMDISMKALILFTDITYKFAFGMTLLMMAAALFSLIYTVIVFLSGNPVPGFTTTMLVLTGSFFGVFAILAIIIKYLSVLVNLVFTTRQYTIESIVKLSQC